MGATYWKEYSAAGNENYEIFSYNGAGHEEVLSMGGWSSLWMLNPFSLPLFSRDLRMIEGQIKGACTTYRFWSGKIAFKESIHMSIEHGTNNSRTANYASLDFYYYIPTNKD